LSRLAPLDHHDLIADIVVNDFVHEGVDEQETPPTGLGEVGRRRRVGYAFGIEASPLIADDVDGLRARLPRREVDAPVAVGG
jgi:hypothetical protein